jgi:hypothetical protein
MACRGDSQWRIEIPMSRYNQVNYPNFAAPAGIGLTLEKDLQAIARPRTG